MSLNNCKHEYNWGNALKLSFGLPCGLPPHTRNSYGFRLLSAGFLLSYASEKYLRGSFERLSLTRGADITLFPDAHEAASGSSGSCLLAMPQIPPI